MKTWGALLAGLGLMVFGGGAQAGTTGPQASITLGASDAQFCNHHENSWTLTKTGVLGEDLVATWTVTATKDGSAHNQIVADGYLTVTNTGTAVATIGNVVVNLQKRWGQKWVSAAADLADATHDYLATSANIVAKASQEDPALNAAHGAGNYTVSGAKGTFVNTTPGAGVLNVTDTFGNTFFSISPEPTLAPAASITLLYSATFDNYYLHLGAGAQVRVEVLVSFGNAGGRGGSGASAPNIDINGNGGLDADEAWVRTVPTRTSRELPTTEECNDTVQLKDLGITTTGSVTFDPISSDIPTDGLTISDTTVCYVSVQVHAGDQGGTITNCAELIGEADTSVLVGDYSFPCCTPIDIEVCSTLTVPGTPPPPVTLSFETYTQGGWGAVPNGNNPGALLANNWFYGSSGVTVGGDHTMTFTSAFGVQNYLPAKGTAGVLTTNLVNPLSSSSGVFGGQVLTLQLNVDFSNHGITTGGFGSLYLVNTGTSLDGQTVAQVLAAANVALGGGTLPDGYSLTDLNALVTDLNESFDNGVESDWAKTHLSTTSSST